MQSAICDTIVLKDLVSFWFIFAAFTNSVQGQENKF